MKKLLTITALITLITATLISQPGCSKENATEEPALESNRWLELLSVLPSNESTLKAAYLRDVAYCTEKMEQYSQILDEYEAVYGAPFIVSSPYSYSDEEWQETLGFVAADVDQMILAGVQPIQYYEAVRGRFNHDDIDNAVKTGPMNDILEVVSYQGQEFYSWGADRQVHLDRRSNIRPLGIGYRLAHINDFLFWVVWTDGIKEMIDSYQGNIDSLADIEDYQLLSGALEGFDIWWAFFSAESQSQSHVREVYQQIIEEPGDNERRQLLVEEIEREARLKPYQALATGAGIDENGFYLVIALANPSQSAARQNAALLEQRINQAKNVVSTQKWSDHIKSMEIESKGRLTTARLYGEVWTCWNSFAIIGTGLYEPLLMHE